MLIRYTVLDPSGELLGFLFRKDMSDIMRDGDQINVAFTTMVTEPFDPDDPLKFDAVRQVVTFSHTGPKTRVLRYLGKADLFDLAEGEFLPSYVSIPRKVAENEAVLEVTLQGAPGHTGQGIVSLMVIRNKADGGPRTYTRAFPIPDEVESVDTLRHAVFRLDTEVTMLAKRG